MPCVNHHQLHILIILILVVPVLVSECAIAGEQVMVQFQQELMNDGEYRYSPGNGTLMLQVKGQFILFTGDSEVVSWNCPGYEPEGELNDIITFKGNGESTLVVNFSSPAPSGHGLYTFNFNVPWVGTEQEVTVEIEHAELVIWGNHSYTTYQRSHTLHIYLDIEAGNSVQLAVLTELIYHLAAGAVISGSFILGFAAYVVWKRKIVRRRLHEGWKWLLSRNWPMEVVRVEGGYVIRRARRKKKVTKKAVRGIMIPDSVMLAIILFAMLASFALILQQPLNIIIRQAGDFAPFVYGTGCLFVVLAVLYVFTADSPHNLALKMSVVGAGFVGSMISYLGVMSLILIIITFLLVYIMTTTLVEGDGVT